MRLLNRGPLFRLLRLERHICPSCHRDNLYRVGRPGSRCRWCGASLVDWAALTATVTRLAAVTLTTFKDAADAACRAAAAFGSAMLGSTWVVDVETATHDDLREGETVTRVSRVQVLALDETEAMLVACQMAATDGRMPTRATVRTSLDLLCEAQVNQPHLRAANPNPLRHAVELRKEVP